MLTRKRVIVALVLAVVALLAVEFIFTTIWDGDFRLPVTVLRSGKQLGPGEVASVYYSDTLALRDPEQRAAYADSDGMEKTDFDGKTFVARVRCSGTRSLFGWWNTHSQFRKILIRVKLTDGRTVEVNCPVSDSKHKPSVVIDVGRCPTSAPAR